MSEQDHLAGLRILENYQQNNRTREDRELITQMNRLKANDIIKGMEVDAEVQNFLDYAKKDAETLDKTHPGYASQLMGIANTRMSDLSPAAYEKAVPMVRQFYDRFDARKQIEAENDQRATTTDYRAMFGEAPTGISYQDSKFAMKAKDAFGVDPVFAEKDGIRIFDRKGTEALVRDADLSRSAFSGKKQGEFESSKMFETMSAEGTARLNDANFKAQQEQRKRESDELNRQFKDDEFVKKAIKSLFKTEIPLPDDESERLTLVEFKKVIRHGKFPLQADGQPDYEAGYKMIEDKRLATSRAEAEAKRDPTKEPVDPKLTDSEANAAGFYKMMEDSDSIISGLPAGSQPGAGSSVLGSVPLVGGTASRSVQSAETQKFVQASQAWVRAKLRKESGAAIGKDEMAQEIATYFPQVGDKPDVIAQKAAMRLVATNNMKISAGRALKGASGGSSSMKVVDGVLQATDMAAGQAFLKANPQADVKFLQINGKRYPVTRNP